MRNLGPRGRDSCSGLGSCRGATAKSWVMRESQLVMKGRNFGFMQCIMLDVDGMNFKGCWSRDLMALYVKLSSSFHHTTRVQKILERSKCIGPSLTRLVVTHNIKDLLPLNISTFTCKLKPFISCYCEAGWGHSVALKPVGSFVSPLYNMMIVSIYPSSAMSPPPATLDLHPITPINSHCQKTKSCVPT